MHRFLSSLNFERMKHFLFGSFIYTFIIADIFRLSRGFSKKFSRQINKTGETPLFLRDSAVKKNLFFLFLKVFLLFFSLIKCGQTALKALYLEEVPRRPKRSQTAALHSNGSASPVLCQGIAASAVSSSRRLKDIRRPC